jgi:anthranilate synthase component 1
VIATRTFVDDTLTPVRAYAALRSAASDGASFLLESVVSGERWGRFTIVGYRPRYEAILGRGGWVVRDGATGEAMAAPGIAPTAPDPLQAIASLLAVTDAPDGPNPAERFARAHVGYLAWDLVHAIDKVPGWPEGTTTAPLARFMGGSTIVVFDNLAQTITLASADPADLDRAMADLGRAVSLRSIALPDRARIPPNVEGDVDDERYVGMVRQAKEYISAGDAFQIVLARTFRVPVAGRDAFDVYRAMRVINPSPYMYYFDLPAAPGERTRTQIAGASPETLVRLDRGVMTTRPLAGTRPRGKTEAEDMAFERELLADPKERAEHVMLIDLGRNDVGRVAEVGSVELVRRMEIERYSHVMHIVSEVRGRVAAGVPPLEVVRAAFPAGTLSGAPKVRAMQIIRELEGGPRGIYGGAIGYVAKTGDLDFAIAIRTAVCRDGVFAVTAGAGIVEASVPQSEADETRSKARGVLCAIEAAPMA